MESFRVRKLRADEVGMALDWAAREGWNPGLNDAACFAAADPGGFMVGEVDGAPAAVISAVKYGAAFGFIGLYIAAPALRGRGYGLRVWQAAMARLEGRVIGLDGVPAQQENYRKSGFRLAHRNARYEGVGGGDAGGGDASGRGGAVVELATVDFADIAAYDCRCFAAARDAFLRAWIRQPGGAALGVHSGDGGLAGYGVIRRCRAGHKIGPLFADSPAVARALFDALTARADAGPVFLDIPEPNSHARALVGDLGMKKVFETARMYTGDFPALPLDNIYGITTFELG